MRRRNDMRRRNSENDIWLWIILAAIFMPAILDTDDPPPEETPPAATQPIDNQFLVEGVVDQLIPTADGTTIVHFDDGRQKELHLGDFDVEIGEWNQFRMDNQGYVHEVWYGEEAIQKSMARSQ